MGILTNNDKVDEIVNEKYIRDELQKQEKSLSIGDHFSNIWNSRHNFEDPWDYLNVFNIGRMFDHQTLPSIEDGEILGSNVATLSNYKGPTETQFANCLESNGLSVWDTNGWWRCLFPDDSVKKRLKMDNKTLHDANILTREKIENDYEHKLGLFFTDYTNYLLWKTNLNKSVSDRKLEEKANEFNWNHTMTTPEDLIFNHSNDKKQVIGKSQFLKFNSTNEGDEEIKELKTYYQDGTMSLKTQKKMTPSDGSKPRVESYEKIMKSDEKFDTSNNHGFSSWFRK
ncbi:hypothetical protein KAFR_0A01680 [Kazachstania africana CBS 2517]|uniref:Mitochondrial peculiar membrane protein 1 n=1 Tax=Kazachstania africana (strain ATCC 22294 / BCRC 22015 / CBS 2517 / CECT 1963 / NBRC 1671 / NRRL Y-8276) TaxID=1071382 RepID=H2AMK6_KAZAF|nr:hypothetical protein KAFR_0A01680 [Kazachstania africana CBS 2517]CCF55606.1 hypothetical protein KAFR_0A01680 [Kazachstania africana CBS 2517]